MNKYNSKIECIRNLAFTIDNRLNLFESYTPKRTELCKSELLFWKQIVSFYGLFADCDSYQIKEKDSLLLLMKDNSLIGSSDYSMAKNFWNDISDFRAWFCHNYDGALYYSVNRKNRIMKSLSSNHQLFLNDIEDADDNQWNMLAKNFEKSFEKYLIILEKGLKSWCQSPQKKQLINDWLLILAKALFKDKELINNILADIAQYEIQNQNLKIKNSALVAQYRKDLDVKYTPSNIEKELKRNLSKRANKEIVRQSIINSKILQNITLIGGL